MLRSPEEFESARASDLLYSAMVTPGGTSVAMYDMPASQIASWREPLVLVASCMGASIDHNDRPTRGPWIGTLGVEVAHLRIPGESRHQRLEQVGEQ